jgi:hypothetical protein
MAFLPTLRYGTRQRYECSDSHQKSRVGHRLTQKCSTSFGSEEKPALYRLSGQRREYVTPSIKQERKAILMESTKTKPDKKPHPKVLQAWIFAIEMIAGSALFTVFMFVVFPEFTSEILGINEYRNIQTDVQTIPNAIEQ